MLDWHTCQICYPVEIKLLLLLLSLLDKSAGFGQIVSVPDHCLSFYFDA